MELPSKRRPTSKTARRSRAHASLGSLCLKELPSEHLELPDPLRLLLATAKVYRNIATLGSGPHTVVLSAAADDLERHAQHLTMVSRHGVEH